MEDEGRGGVGKEKGKEEVVKVGGVGCYRNSKSMLATD